MKILQLFADWKWTGPAEPVLHAVCGLRDRGHQVDFACAEPPAGTPGALLERAAERGVTPVHVFARGQGYVPLRDRSEVRALAALLAREGYDVVHAHHTRDHLLARRALRTAARLRLVVSWHHGEPIPATPWHRLLLGPRRNLGLTVLSEALAARAMRGLSWPRERIAVAPGVVDTDRFAPREADPALRQSLGLAPDETAVGIVARLQPHRRFELLLDAFARARETSPALRLVVVGRGTRARQVLEEPVARLGLESAVVRAGYRREDYRDVLACFSALVFLVPGSDGSCRALLEAMALGIPAIASRRGVLPELVADGETGVLVDEDPHALARALADVAREPERWRALGVAARKRALERHPVHRHAERLEALYLRLLGAS